MHESPHGCGLSASRGGEIRARSVSKRQLAAKRRRAHSRPPAVEPQARRTPFARRSTRTLQHTSVQAKIGDLTSIHFSTLPCTLLQLPSQLGW
jgi:hypothetical protein